jgi:iron complex outermembrane receptor protein
MPSLNANVIANDTLSFQSNLYLRSASRKVFNGNTTDTQSCADPTLLCLGDNATPLIDTSGAQIPSSVLGGGIAGENDDSAITSVGIGGSLQGTAARDVFGRKNNLVIGASLDHADVDFNSTNELGIIDPSTLIVAGTGMVIDQPDGVLAPVRLETTTSYYGLYATDTLDLTPRLSVTVGGRYNLALIHLMDKIGTALSGRSQYSRFNPSAGAAYKLMPSLTGYVGYAEANRAPTAGEIACSNPAKPCSLDNFLTSDPPGLRQVVVRTYEAGLRGRFAASDENAPGRITWNLGLFRSDLSDDIFNVPASLVGSGFFENVGSTRRQGIEAGLTYRDDKWQLSANYSLVDATFQNRITLSSPNNPFADANGNVHVAPGDHIPGVPQHRLKLDADYAITAKWAIGGDLIVESGQYFFGDPSNQNPQLGGFYVVNLRSSYRITDNVELFGQIENLLDSKYATFGIFGDVTKTPLPGVSNPSDSRFISAAPPLAGYAGIRVRL